MAIKITENGVVKYENEPNVNRELFPNVPGSYASPEQIEQAVNEWLDNHPEATTTVEDGSITRAKLDAELNESINEIDKLKENLSDLQELADTKAPAIYETASGEIASFSDGADDMPLKSCVVNIEPIQEGEGDPSPDNVRPISGRTVVSMTRTGKNLLWKARQSSTMNGITWTLNDDGSITASGTSTGRSYIRIIISTRDAYTLPKGTYTYSLNPTGSDYANIKSLIGSYKGNNYYKNVCAVGPSNNFANVFVWNDSDLTAVLDVAAEIAEANKTVNCTVYPQIELGSLASPYEEYQGETYDIEFPTEAGTVYDGTLDAVSWKLVVDRAIVNLSSEDINTMTVDDKKRLKIPKAFFNGILLGNPSYKVADILCNQFVAKTSDETYSQITGISLNRLGDIYICGGDIQTVSAFANIAPIQIVYPLAEPVEYQLTPQEIRSLLGVNNIWSDGGNVEVTYPADTKMYIDQKITEAIAAAMA